MTRKIAVLIALVVAVAAPVYANYALPPHGQLEVVCPDGYAVRLRSVPGQSRRLGIVFCEVPAPVTATTLPPLLSPLVTPRPTDTLPAMPTR